MLVQGVAVFAIKCEFNLRLLVAADLEGLVETPLRCQETPYNFSGGVEES